MQIEQRDYIDSAVGDLIKDFKQMKASQVHDILFHDLTKKPCYNALNRLKDQRLITTIEIPTPGGSQGGRGQFVWTPRGAGRWTIDHHAIEVVNTYIEFIHIQRAGRLKVVRYMTEPDCHERIGNVILEPDLYLELLLTNGKTRRLWLEIDMHRRGYKSEGTKQLEAKLQRYWDIYDGNNGSGWPSYLLAYDVNNQPIYDRVEGNGQVSYQHHWYFPLVVWVVRDSSRADTLKRLIGRMPAEAQELFHVCERANLGEMFT